MTDTPERLQHAKELFASGAFTGLTLCGSATGLVTLDDDWAITCPACLAIQGEDANRVPHPIRTHLGAQ
jgi:hypothetical protein